MDILPIQVWDLIFGQHYTETWRSHSMLIIIHFCSLVVKLLQCRKKKSDGNCETSTQHPVPTRVLDPKSNPPEAAAEHLVRLMCQLLFTWCMKID
jgi:hypothetical protein